MGGELRAPTGWARVHPLQRAALCLKGTRPLSRLILGWGSTPPPQPESGQGSLKMAGLPQGPQADRPLRPALPLTRPGSLVNDCLPAQTQFFYLEKRNRAFQTFFFSFF